MKRYDLVYRDDDQAFMEEDKEGEYVYADEATARIADLEAENHKLREENTSLKDTNLYRLFKKWMITAMELKEENEKLKGALREISETDRDHLSYRIARRVLGGEG